MTLRKPVAAPPLQSRNEDAPTVSLALKRQSLPSQQLLSSASQLKLTDDVLHDQAYAAAGLIPRDQGSHDKSVGRIVFNVVMAVFVRSAFVAHSMAAIWMAVVFVEDNSIWTFSLVSLSIVIEGAMTVFSTAGHERSWFSPCFLLYIGATVPPIWILKLRSSTCEQSDIHCLFLDRIVLFFLVVGRWLLPRGRISRDQLTQILLANIAMAADIADYFSLLTVGIVHSSMQTQCIVLAAWTASLLQFPLILTSTGARKARIAVKENEFRPGFSAKLHPGIDIWAILLAHTLQDIPFLSTRLYLLAVKGVVNEAMIFFACKNALILLVQTYRLIILWDTHKRNENKSNYERDVHRNDKRRLLFSGRRMENKGRAESAVQKDELRKGRIKRSKSKDMSFSEQREIPMEGLAETSTTMSTKSGLRKTSAIEDIVVKEVGGHYHLVSGKNVMLPKR